MSSCVQRQNAVLSLREIQGSSKAEYLGLLGAVASRVLVWEVRGVM